MKIQPQINAIKGENFINAFFYLRFVISVNGDKSDHLLLHCLCYQQEESTISDLISIFHMKVYLVNNKYSPRYCSFLIDSTARKDIIPAVLLILKKRCKR